MAIRQNNQSIIDTNNDSNNNDNNGSVMVDGIWDPQAHKNPEVFLNQTLLNLFVQQNEQPMFSEDEQQKHASVMFLDHKVWHAQLQNFKDEQLWSIICFLTKAEKLYSGWHAAENSPVIAITQLLKQRGHTLTKEQIQWIRRNSDNRFLPYGRVL